MGERGISREFPPKYALYIYNLIYIYNLFTPVIFVPANITG